MCGVCRKNCFYGESKGKARTKGKIVVLCSLILYIWKERNSKARKQGVAARSERGGRPKGCIIKNDRKKQRKSKVFFVKISKIKKFEKKLKKLKKVRKMLAKQLDLNFFSYYNK